jgi:hypothetical protein
MQVFVCLAGRGVYPIVTEWAEWEGDNPSVENHKSVIQLCTRNQNREHTLIMMLTRWP